MPVSCIKYFKNYYFGFRLEATKCTEKFATHSPRCVRMLGLNLIYHCSYKHVRLLEWQSGSDLLVSKAKTKKQKKFIHGQYLPMAANLKRWQIIRFNLYQYLVFERFITLCLLRTYMCILVS